MDVIISRREAVYIPFLRRIRYVRKFNKLVPRIQSACVQNRTEFFFLSFPLLLCLKLVRSGRLSSPHLADDGAGTTFYMRRPSCS